jgi:hypothetical protein
MACVLVRGLGDPGGEVGEQGDAVAGSRDGGGGAGEAGAVSGEALPGLGEEVADFGEEVRELVAGMMPPRHALVIACGVHRDASRGVGEKAPPTARRYEACDEGHPLSVLAPTTP